LTAPNSASRLGVWSSPDHGWLAEPASQRQQLAGNLLDLAAGVLGEYQHLSHAYLLLLVNV